jgi:hypothetical protein
MLLEGLWSSEIYGLFGWESTGVLMLRDGRAVGGGNNHTSVGEYSVEGNTATIGLNIRYHGSPRTLFGSTEAEFRVHLRGECSDGVITGSVYREDKPKLTLSVRLTRRADLP